MKRVILVLVCSLSLFATASFAQHDTDHADGGAGFHDIAAPVGLRFPRLGTGGVISATGGVFTLYYIGLIMGEALGNRLIVSPVLAMWAPSLLFGVGGLVALWLSGKTRGPTIASGSVVAG